MSNSSKNTVMPTSGKSVEQPLNQPNHEVQDERYPGTFFRVPGVPMPGKTTWSLAK
jgi:hypothetical protein